LLEGESLVFRGDLRLELPFARMREVALDGDELVVKTEDQEARFELGAPVAERWMRLIKEPKSLFEKLEVGPESRVAVVDVNDSLFVTALRERTANVSEGRVPGGAPVIFFGAETKDALRKIQLLRARMIDSGVLWVVRPKGSRAIAETDVYEAVKGAGLVDTKVVAFSRTHTAHKCIIPLELRGKAVPRPPILSIPPSAPMLHKAKTGKGAAKPGRSVRPEAKKAPTRKAAKKKTPAGAKRRK